LGVVPAVNGVPFSSHSWYNGTGAAGTKIGFKLTSGALGGTALISAV
jgi:hypothetical protein